MKHLMIAGMLMLAVAAGVQAEDKPGGKKPGERPGAGKRPGKPGEGHPGGGPMFGKLFENADADKDGKVTLDEFKKAAENAPGGRLKDRAEQIFTRLDANGDGSLSKDEVKKAGEQFQNRRPGGKPGEKKPGQKKPDDK